MARFLDPMPTGQSIVDEVRMLLNSTRQGQLSQTQFENQRTAMLLSAEAKLIERREALKAGLASGSITGLQAADTRADLDVSEKELREAASLVGVGAAKTKSKRSLSRLPDPTASEPELQPGTMAGNGMPAVLVDEPTLVIEKGESLPPRILTPLERPEVGILVKRVAAVLPTVAGAVVFAPVGLLVVLGKLEGWMPIWGVVMLLMALACTWSAREQWENPDPT